MSCACTCQKCGSQQHPTDACDCLDEIQSGVPVVLDEDCNQRALMSGAGVLATDENGIMRSTDGSASKGLIKLNPEESPALTTLIGSDAKGNLFSIGKEAPEGSVILKKGGRWVVSTIDTAKKIFDSAQLRTGSGKIAAFICGSSGTVELGILSGCPSSYIFVNQDGIQECHDIPTLTGNVTKEICTNAPELPAGTSASGFLTCESGVIYKAPIAEQVSPSMIHHQEGGWYQIGVAGLNLSSPQTLFSFTPSLLPGYKPEYKTMWLWANLIAGSHGADYRISITLGGIEIMYGLVREEPNKSGDFINPTLVFPFPISGAPLTVVKGMDLGIGGNTGEIFEMEFRMRLVGWST